jgi:choline-glycine betaine transporter
MNKKLIFIPIIVVLLLVIAYIVANTATTNAKEQVDNYIHKNTNKLFSNLNFSIET